MECQVGGLPHAGRALSRVDKLGQRVRQSWGFVVRGVTKVARDPRILVRKAAAAAGSPQPTDCQASMAEGGAPFRPEPLGLKVGEKVRVKSWEEVRRTLDADERCAGLGWMSLQQQYCGRTFTVARRIERFFDERARRLLKVRDVVFLDGVHCRPPKEGPWSYAGCDRMCFLFWKEAWLERLSPEEDQHGDARS